MGYHTFTISKKSGGVRVINAPDEVLKQKQRDLLKDMQGKLWISKRAHGFAVKRNILTNATAHVGKKWILNLDIRNFFPSITRDAIGMIEGIGDRQEARWILLLNTPLMFHGGSLPQGAPTSPFLSNLCMREFDTRIVNLLRKLVSDDIEFTRYADDLTFSSNSHAIEKVIDIVKSKLNSMNMEINTDKTRLAGRGQRQEVTGLNINSGRPTVPKKYRRKVRALVHRASNGWLITHKQKERLLGRISHISLCHPGEAKKYREMLLPVKISPEVSRKLRHVKRVHLKTRTKARNTTTLAKNTIPTNGQSGRCLRRVL